MMLRYSLIVVVVGLLCGVARAAELSIDFTEAPSASVLQSGFVAYGATSGQTSPLSQTYATPLGDVTVGVTGQSGIYNRGGATNGGAFTYADLYNDFIYRGGPFGFVADATVTGLSITLSGPGIAPSTAYDLTFYSFDPADNQGAHTTTIAGAAGTTGTPAVIAWTSGADPASNGQFASTQRFTSDAGGALTFDVSETYVGNTDSSSGIRINGLELASVPEPTAIALVGVATLGLLGRRRRQA